MAQLIEIAAARHRLLVTPSDDRNPPPREVESLPALPMLPGQRAADAIATFTWHKRVRFFDELVGEGLAWVERELTGGERDACDARRFVHRTIAQLRGTLTDILDRLDRAAPLAPDGDAMRVYRVSDDPRRIAEAQRYWGSAEAERLGMVPGSNLMVLRTVVIRLEMLADHDGERSCPPTTAP